MSGRRAPGGSRRPLRTGASVEVRSADGGTAARRNQARPGGRSPGRPAGSGRPWAPLAHGPRLHPAEGRAPAVDRPGIHLTTALLGRQAGQPAPPRRGRRACEPPTSQGRAASDEARGQADTRGAATAPSRPRSRPPRAAPPGDRRHRAPTTGLRRRSRDSRGAATISRQLSGPAIRSTARLAYGAARSVAHAGGVRVAAGDRERQVRARHAREQATVDIPEERPSRFVRPDQSRRRARGSRSRGSRRRPARAGPRCGARRRRWRRRPKPRFRARDSRPVHSTVARGAWPSRRGRSGRQSHAIGPWPSRRSRTRHRSAGPARPAPAPAGRRPSRSRGLASRASGGRGSGPRRVANIGSVAHSAGEERRAYTQLTSGLVGADRRRYRSPGEDRPGGRRRAPHRRPDPALPGARGLRRTERRRTATRRWRWPPATTPTW